MDCRSYDLAPCSLSPTNLRPTSETTGSCLYGCRLLVFQYSSLKLSRCSGCLLCDIVYRNSCSGSRNTLATAGVE